MHRSSSTPHVASAPLFHPNYNQLYLPSEQVLLTWCLLILKQVVPADASNLTMHMYDLIELSNHVMQSLTLLAQLVIHGES